MTETQYTDEFFINLIMDYDEIDDTIYPLWAVWCEKSEDKYFIDGKDHHFYTHVRTEEEIAFIKKQKELMLFVVQQKLEHEPIEPESDLFNEFMEYESYIRSLELDENYLEVIPKTFDEWKSSK